MNPTDKFEQIQIYKRLNPVELEATVLKHEQQIKDLAEHLLELKQSMEFNKEKKEWVGLTYEEVSQVIEKGYGVRDSIEIALDKIKEKNK